MSYFENVEIMRDAYEGVINIKNKGEKYLRRATDMSDVKYEVYKSEASFLDMVNPSINSYIGRIFKRPPSIDGIDGIDVDKLDTGGLTFVSLLHWMVRELLLVDGGGVQVDIASDTAAPIVARYNTESILNVVRDSLGRLELVELKEIPNVYGEDFVDVRKILFINDQGYYSVRVVGKTKENHEFNDITDIIVPTVRGTPWSEIPFIVFGERTNPMFAPLAHSCIEYYQASAKWWLTINFTFPVVVYEQGEPGIDDQEGDIDLKLGVDEVVSLRKGEKLSYLTLDPQGLASLESKMTEIKAYANELSGQSSSGSNIAAETKRMNEDTHTSRISTLISLLNSSINKMMGFIAQWADSNDEYSVVLNTQLTEQSINPNTLNAINNLVQVYGYPQEWVIDYLRKHGVGSDMSVSDVLESVNSKLGSDFGGFE